MDKVAVVVPTNRPEKMADFKKAWGDINLITVWDGDKPVLEYKDKKYSVKDIMGKYSSTIINRCAYVRNLGFAYIARFLPKVEYIVTLDDDVTPVGDTIGDHVKALNMKVPVNWMSVGNAYTRGFPYEVRDEAPVMMSHGVWLGSPDHDAPTQLVQGLEEMKFHKMPIPKGIYCPLSGMNFAFKREMLPYYYQAPRTDEVNRMGDIWGGIIAKRIADEKGWATVTGYSVVHHDRASNVWTNLKKEPHALKLNETFWKGQEDDKYFKKYKRLRRLYESYILSYEGRTYVPPTMA